MVSGASRVRFSAYGVRVEKVLAGTSQCDPVLPVISHVPAQAAVPL